MVVDAKSQDIAYQPSMDINQLTVNILLNRLYTHGSENFKIDKDHEFSSEWKALMKAREEYYNSTQQLLVKDL